MTYDEPPKNDKLRLVIENDPARIAERQKQIVADDAHDQSAASLATLVANLLRVLAGAGQPYAMPGDLLKAAEHYRDAYNAGSHGQMPGLEDLILYHLFRENEERDKPQTEEEWLHWAADNPERDYEEERRSLLHQLRRHVLREIASTITGSDLQIRRERGEIDDVLRRLEQAGDRYFNRPSNLTSSYRRNRAEREIAKLRGADTQVRDLAKEPITKVRSQKPNLSSRQEIADLEIEKLQARERDKMIAGLQRHQWIALYAVHSGETRAFDAVDAFTFDVLASMKLLERKPGQGKSKRDWQLTEFGVLAISRAPGAILEPSQP
ncbi:hypothetical protein [Rhodoplanes sp. Z2-YC6860]|uniref:hypothetical protein n=1 Tax=Rhodoplanes sp. Z2-YC6860 TaxID=674703 RepID=UPI00078DEF6A|nr:hypothetical protein [Rhodoplanes sp. Z2-YC6860]AMN42936.1 hypothetical protein RHPLAN_45070 [Rhodoplanes sp. Z2-YC6860]